MMRGLSLSPSEYVAQAVRTAGVTLTLGVFVGSALTSGIAVGIAAAVLANEKVLRRLRVKAIEALTAARDAALSTQEGQALHRAVLHSGGAVDQAQAPSPPAPDPQRQLAAKLEALNTALGVGALSPALYEQARRELT
mmetsp:Transcript_27530/g.65051  ORF Transcript_27530/g.65051 Transcript_27530/m.65051 type:complete len:138 (-) Transcript_27530:89-502(-)|eukprot:scaffold85780_cov92-Phaeocystis_antarctica.AAC.2